MALIHCLNCGRLMLEKPGYLCNDCLKRQQEDIKNIKAYLARNPRATLIEVQRETGVSLQTIRAMFSDPGLKK
ncbi:hypothetical protein [Paenibacillus validus]|uniref:Flagellar protein n=1 Tax=Paenibacillus validus TaxID=44253 RepID=A0A7X2Z981_9BACL|nr:hypothetical protein [Paenibacillus validus]MUG70581.1 hypothetical protein [Paenibacillus validus]